MLLVNMAKNGFPLIDYSGKQKLHKPEPAKIVDLNT